MQQNKLLNKTHKCY